MFTSFQVYGLGGRCQGPDSDWMVWGSRNEGHRDGIEI